MGEDRRPPLRAGSSRRRSVPQLEENLAAVERLDFTDDELAEIDRYATESSLDIWAASSET